MIGRPPNPAPAKFSEDENAILERLHDTMPGLSMEAIKIFWTAFKTEAIRRLADERKPVDLGFVKIYQVPKPFLKQLKGRLASSIEIVVWYAKREDVPSLDPYEPDHRRRLKLMLDQDRVSSIRGSWRGQRRISPSKGGRGDKKKQLQGTNNHNQVFGKVPDPLPAEQPVGTDAAPG